MRPATKQEAERYLAKKKLREDVMRHQRRANIFIICIFLLTLLMAYGIM
jgi:hypothetical protein